STKAFEDEFGQISGAHIGALLESDAIDTDRFRERMHTLSEAVANLEHVAEVTSLTHLLRPEDPGALRDILSADGRVTVLWARLDLPLADLEARRPVVRAFQELVEGWAPVDAEVHFVGVSVVEDAYATIVLASLARTIVISTAVILAVLLILFGSLRSVLISTAGVALAVPVTLGAMHVMGQSMTIVNSMVATMVLVIGIADAIHMLDAYRTHLAAGSDPREAGRRMLADTGLPCLMTTLTTAVGFLALSFADLGAIRGFGLSVTVGVVAVYVLNMVMIPSLLSWFPLPNRERKGRVERLVRRWIAGIGAVTTRRPLGTAAMVLLMLIVSAAAIPRLVVQQRFNEEVSQEHPIRRGQMLLERNFGGILGPELHVRRAPRGSGEPLLDPSTLEALAAFADRLTAHPAVTDVESVLGFADGLPSSTDLLALREAPGIGERVRFLVNEDGTGLALHVRTRDIGTREATELVEWIRGTAAETLGPGYEVEVVGQWWLAQLGMSRLLRDLVVSFATACALVLPMLALMLRRVRLFLIALLPNVGPPVVALGFMALAGIHLRIGTAMVLAIAIGIAIDDTVHFFHRLREEELPGRPAHLVVERALSRTGNAVVYTSLVLVCGFLSMTSVELLALRDMGLVGAVTFASALLFDLLLAPSLYLLTAGEGLHGSAVRARRLAERPAS
ncbi:MAG: MMPL family transporter, partial [Planctomycetota bacterium]|nr:MMPL family transporter [Planctomycetota bacterium]